MITEDYVSFETAKLLKEKGFSAFVHYYYDKYGELLYTIITKQNMDSGSTYIICPTLQMTMKWLREVHNIYVEVSINEKLQFGWSIHRSVNNSLYFSANSKDVSYTTHEQACEAAVKYCLENLI
jgi:hypothetical protein